MFSAPFDRNQRHCVWNDPRFPVVTAQWPWEIENMAMIVKERGPKTIVEIGTQDGGTLRYWLEILPEDGVVYAIDPAPDLHGLEDPRIRLLKTRSDDANTLRMIGELESLDFLFIDGDHNYEGVRYDFETYGPKVRAGGMIALHDIVTIGREDCAVPLLWQEIRWAGYITQELHCIHDVYPGGGIGIVYR